MLYLQRLPECGCLALSDNIHGLVVQGPTVRETIEIARDGARKLIELEDRDRTRALFPDA